MSKNEVQLSSGQKMIHNFPAGKPQLIISQLAKDGSQLRNWQKVAHSLTAGKLHKAETAFVTLGEN